MELDSVTMTGEPFLCQLQHLTLRNMKFEKESPYLLPVSITHIDLYNVIMGGKLFPLHCSIFKYGV